MELVVDPFEERRRGTRRVRAITASVAGAALAGTGVVALAVATPSASASSGSTAQQPAQQPAPQPAAPGTDNGGGGYEEFGGDQGSGSQSFSVPAQPPAPAGGFGGGMASSGGS